ncbi:MAG: alpha-L-fucosidase [Bacteroidales bacterium]
MIGSFIVATTAISAQTEVRYEANRESISTHYNIPEWFRDAKFGIYFHWGVYSVPAFGNEWYPRRMYIDGSDENIHHIETYGHPEEWPYHYFITGAEDKKGNFVQFHPKLKSEGGNFDPDEWADLFAKSGARFAGPVAEHHDGFSMWDSEVNPWNAKNQGPGLDLVGLLTQAIREKDMKIILSMHHAFHGFTQTRRVETPRQFYDHAPETNDPELQILYAQLTEKANEKLWLDKHKEIIDNYQPDIIWQDFNLTAIREPVLLEFLAYYYNKAEQWNKEVVATYKDALNNDVAVLDYERGGPADLVDYYWLTDDAISRSSWCYTEGIRYYSPTEVLHGFLDRVSKNGNLLLNISPKADGSIPQEQKEILLSLGDWLGKYGEAVYNTRTWVKYGEGPTKMGLGHRHTNENKVVGFEAPSQGTARDIRFTRSKDNKVLYAIILGWPGDNKTLTINSLSSNEFNIQSLQNVALLLADKDQSISLKYKQNNSGMHITMCEKQSDEMAYVLKLTFSNKIPD